MKARLGELADRSYPLWVGLIGLAVMGFAAWQFVRGCGPDPAEIERENRKPKPVVTNPDPDYLDDEEAIVVDPAAPGGQRRTTWGDARRDGLAP